MPNVSDCDARTFALQMYYIEVSNAMSSSGALTNVIHLLTNSQTLANLEFRECGLNDNAIYTLAKGLKHSKLKKLDLRDNHFTSRGATELDHVLKDHPTLTKEMVEMPIQLQ
ncbi:hypothetical protein EMCRGX_G010450 [Ephydatia muelleri]